MSTNFPASNDSFAAPSAPTTTVLNSAGDSTRNHGQSHQDMGDAIVALEANVPLIGHDHSNTGSRPTQQLKQVNTHQSPDTDSATTAIHHTIGAGANQAAAGNHTHPYPVVPSCQVTIGYPYTIPQNGDTILSWANSVWDTDPAGNMFNPGQPNFITIQTTGKYRVELMSTWQANSSGIRAGKILLNGTSNDKVVVAYNINAAAYFETNLTVGREAQFNAGDTLYVDYYQNSGSALGLVNTIGGTTSHMGNRLIVTWVQP